MAKTANPAPRKPSARTRTAPKKPDEAVPPPQKNSWKKKAIQPETSSTEDDEEYRIEWTNELCHSLIAEITNSAVIKQGLFPAPGTKSQPSNTAVKNDYLWMLCEAVFEDHTDYKKVFPKIQSNAEHKKSWILKMKNKLAVMVKKVRQHRDAMGQTGEGISSRDQIDMLHDNTFTNKWGLGNNDTPVDLLAVLPGLYGEGYDSSSDFLGWDFGDSSGVAEIEEDVDEKDGGSGDENIIEDAEKNTIDQASILQGSDVEDEDIVETQVPTKRKTGGSMKMESAKKMKKNGPLPGKLTPAPKPSESSIKKKSLVDQFADTSKAEEETAQKRIELKKEKVAAEKDAKVASVKAKAAVQMKKQELKTQYTLEKMQLEHQYRLAQLQARNGMPVAAGSSSHGVIAQSMASASGSSLSQMQGSLCSELNTPFSFNELELDLPRMDVGFQFRH